MSAQLPAQPRAAQDRVAFVPLALALCWPIALILSWSGPFDLTFFGAPLVLLSWGVSAVCALLLALVWMIERAWRRAITTLVLPLLTLVAGLNIGFIWGSAIWAGDHVHFWMLRQAYLREVGSLPIDRGPRLAVFEWGGFAGVTHAVVYDESDEIGLPPNQQSETWKIRIAPTMLDCGVWGTPAGGHFYIVRIGC
jgi:hypothetical protein